MLHDLHELVGELVPSQQLWIIASVMTVGYNINQRCSKSGLTALSKIQMCEWSAASGDHWTMWRFCCLTMYSANCLGKVTPSTSIMFKVASIITIWFPISPPKRFPSPSIAHEFNTISIAIICVVIFHRSGMQWKCFVASGASRISLLLPTPKWDAPGGIKWSSMPLSQHALAIWS